MGKKFVFYLKGGNRSITITDHKEKRSLKDLQDIISNMVSSDKIIRFTTSADCLMLKPAEIGGVHIQELSSGAIKEIENSWENNFNMGDDFSIADEETIDDEVEKIIVEEEKFEISKEEEELQEKFQVENDNIDLSKELDKVLDDTIKETEKTEVKEIQETPTENKKKVTLGKKQKKVEDVKQINFSDNFGEPDVTSIYTNPNSVPDVGVNKNHIFDVKREDGTPLPKSKLNDPLIDKIAKRAKESGMQIKPVPIKRK